MTHQNRAYFDLEIPDVGPLPIQNMVCDPVFRSRIGVLYRGDCVDLLPGIATNSVDTVFADPPFNIGKEYGGLVDDNKKDGDYLEWCRSWLRECVRVLKPGGSFFLYNLPRWNIHLGVDLEDLGLTFRHWIAVNLTAGLPIAGRLYPSHYSLLYYTKGIPRTFRRIRTPFALCRHCQKEVRDYGGHRSAMHPDGVSLKDVWDDVTPVRN
jgi:site-specific DNA-methyltransferase (adenine-specific)